MERRFLICLLFIATLAFGTDISQEFQTLFPGWLLPIGAALLVGFSIPAFGYMFSTIFNLPQVKTWAKQEFGEIIFTAFLVVVVLFCINFSEMLYQAATGSPLSTSSISFLNEAKNSLIGFYKESAALSFFLSIYSGLPLQYAGQRITGMGGGLLYWTPPIPISIPIVKLTLAMGTTGSMSGMPFYSLWVIQTKISEAQGIVLNAALLAGVIGTVLDFAIKYSLSFFIPFGILLSAFSLTRKIGRAFISFGLVLYIFVPTGIIISKETFDAVPKPNKPGIAIEGMEGLDYETIERGVKAALLGNYRNIPCSIAFYTCVAATAGIGTGVCETIETICRTAVDVAYYINQGKLIIEAAKPLGESAGTTLVSMMPAYFSQGRLEKANAKVMEGAIETFSNYVPWLIAYSIPIYLTPLVIYILVVTAGKAIAASIGGETQLMSLMVMI